MADDGVWASALEHTRAMVPRSRRRGLRWCPDCGDKRVPANYAGTANGVCMTVGCEWHMRMWVKDPLWHARRDAWIDRLTKSARRTRSRK